MNTPDSDYKEYCYDLYVKTWEHEFLIESSGKSSKSARENARRAAQRRAIDKVYVEACDKYLPKVSIDDIWAEIAKVHKAYASKLEEFGVAKEQQADVISRVVSAHESWLKTSGHSFERYISTLHSDLLEQNEIRFILKSDLTKMIKRNRLSNTPEDIEGLRSWGKDFDLYAIQTVHEDVHVFGCIQSKTSIRDRVGRDVGFSKNAMDGLFWSAAVCLDGQFLKMPEFIHMVNGGGSYPQNGWHGMYALSGIDDNNGRIFKVNNTMDILIDHAVQAAKQFISDRRMLNEKWRPV